MGKVAQHGGAWPPVPIGLERLATAAFRGSDLRPVALELTERLQQTPEDAAALFDLGIIFQLFGQRDNGLLQQAHALALEQVYTRPAARRGEDALSLLMFAVPGDFMANTPIEFILHDAPITLHVVYLGSDGALPQHLPPHDVALVGIGESIEARSYLRGLAARLAHWPCPVLNAPLRIIDLARDRLCQVLADAPGIEIPVTAEVSRDDLGLLACNKAALTTFLCDAATLPIIARPVGSHAGQGLEKLDDGAAILRYVDEHPAPRYAISRFVDYASADGLFRKYRIALIDGAPFLCHMAISGHWMVHYLNAGMTQDADKRAEEAHFMAAFRTDFASRHAAGLAALHKQIGLDYFVIDCAESPDGRLLIFEADTAMIIHSMDPPEVFPYKAAQMEKVYAAFCGMLSLAACRVSARAG